MGGDKLGKCGDVCFFSLRHWDDDVGVWGVSSSFASKFELRVWYLFFIKGSVYRSPMASVLGPFFVKYVKSISDRCRSFKYKLVFLLQGTPPL